MTSPAESISIGQHCAAHRGRCASGCTHDVTIHDPSTGEGRDFLLSVIDAALDALPKGPCPIACAVSTTGLRNAHARLQEATLCDPDALREQLARTSAATILSVAVSPRLALVETAALVCGIVADSLPRDDHQRHHVVASNRSMTHDHTVEALVTGPAWPERKPAHDHPPAHDDTTNGTGTTSAS